MLSSIGFIITILLIGLILVILTSMSFPSATFLLLFTLVIYVLCATTKSRRRP